MERGTLQRKTEDALQEEEDDLPDDATGEEIYQARLKKLTAERNLYNFKSLTHEDRDILAYNIGADLLDKPEKKKRKRKKARPSFHRREEGRGQPIDGVWRQRAGRVRRASPPTHLALGETLAEARYGDRHANG